MRRHLIITIAAAVATATIAGAQNPNHWQNVYSAAGALDGTETFTLQLVSGTCLSGPAPVPLTCQRFADLDALAVFFGGTDTFLTVEVDGVPLSVLAPTLNFLGTDFLLVESPDDDFAISLLAPGADNQLIVNSSGAFGASGPSLIFDGVDFTYTKNAVAAALVESFIWQNTTAAAAGLQQWSPAIVLRGQGWKTEATAASQSVEFALQARAVEGFSNPDGLLSISASINGGAYDPLAFFDSGVLNSTGGLIFPNNKRLSWFDSGGTAREILTVDAFDDLVFNFGETLPGSFIFELTAGEELFVQTSANDRVFQVRHSDGRGAFGAATFPNPDTMLEIYTDGVDNALQIHEDSGANDAYLRILRGGVFWDLGQLGTTDFKFKSNAGIDLVTFQTDGDVDFAGNLTLGGVNTPPSSEFSLYTVLFGPGFFVSSPLDLILQADEDADASGEVVFRTNGSDRGRFTNAGNLVVSPGTIDGAVTADHVDAMSEIAAGIKRGPDATDTHLLTTDVTPPGSLDCLEMDTDGSVVLSGGACGGGSPTLDSILDPVAATAFVMGAIAETVTWDFQAAFTTGCQLCIKSSIGAATGGTLVDFTTHDADVDLFRVSDNLGEVFFIEAGGDIGVGGIANPTAPLHVRSDGSNGLKIEETGGGELWNIWTDSAGTLVFNTATGNAFTINNSTRHGIFLEDLRVQDELAVNQNSDAAQPLDIEADGGNEVVRYREVGGTEYFELSVSTAGDLFWRTDGGDVVLTLSDADGDVTIHDLLRIVPKVTAPATCSIGDVYTDTSGAICHCSSTDTWEALGATGSCA